MATRQSRLPDGDIKTRLVIIASQILRRFLCPHTAEDEIACRVCCIRQNKANKLCHFICGSLSLPLTDGSKDSFVISSLMLSIFCPLFLRFVTILMTLQALEQLSAPQNLQKRQSLRTRRENYTPFLRRLPVPQNGFVKSGSIMTKTSRIIGHLSTAAFIFARSSCQHRCCRFPQSVSASAQTYMLVISAADDHVLVRKSESAAAVRVGDESIELL